MWRNGSSGRLHRKTVGGGPPTGKPFAFGALAGAAITWCLFAVIMRYPGLRMQRSFLGKGGYDPDLEYELDGVGKRDVRPSSLTIRGEQGHACHECEKALSRVQEEYQITQKDLKICLDESMRRDEENFQSEEKFQHEVDAFVGIQTGYTAERDLGTDYDYTIRRKTIRETWFRSDDLKLSLLLEKHKIVVKFVIGHHPSSLEEDEKMKKEMEKYQDFLQLNIEEEYNNLVEKSRKFFLVVLKMYSPKYIIKVDDDVYLKLNRLPSVLSQWSMDRVDYTGCMKTGAIQADKRYKWYEEQHALLGDNTYFAHSWGSMYVLSHKAAKTISEIDEHALRYLANEDVTVGMWMLALEMKHFDDRRMCQNMCGSSGVGLFDIPTPGLIPVVERMRELHSSADCMADEDDFDVKVPKLTSAIQFV